MNSTVSNLSWKTLAGLVALLGLAAFCIHKGQAEIAYGLIAFCLAQFGQRWAVKGVADKVDATHEALVDLHEKVDIVHSQIVNVARVRPGAAAEPGTEEGATP